MLCLRVPAACCLTLSLAVVLSFGAAAQPSTEIPIVAGLKVTLAVHVPNAGPAANRIAQSDYEMVVEVSSVTAEAIGLSTRIEGQDGAGRPAQVTISRRIPRKDLTTRDGQIEKELSEACRVEVSGSDAYNQDLSSRHAAAVRAVLVSDFKVSAGRLSTAGFGESRPRETNETIAGRARNRRVALVRDCQK